MPFILFLKAFYLRLENHHFFVNPNQAIFGKYEERVRYLLRYAKPGQIHYPRLFFTGENDLYSSFHHLISGYMSTLNIRIHIPPDFKKYKMG